MQNNVLSLSRISCQALKFSFNTLIFETVPHSDLLGDAMINSLIDDSIFGEGRNMTAIVTHSDRARSTCLPTESLGKLKI